MSALAAAALVLFVLAIGGAIYALVRRRDG